MYKIKEIAEILNVSDKSVRRYLNSYFSINNGAYEVSEKMLNILKNDYLGQSADNLRTGSDTENEFPIIEPPISEQQQIVEYLDEQTQLIDKTISIEEKRIELLKEYRQSLISEVVTGKLKVTTDE